MGRRQIDSELIGHARLIVLLLVGIVSFSVLYVCFNWGEKVVDEEKVLEKKGECCSGIEHLELWGDAVRWGSDFKVESGEECCRACKDMCSNGGGVCLCDSWVFCGDRDACGPKFGECWLKKQKDTLNPDRRDSGDNVLWTSGLIFGKGEVQNLPMHGLWRHSYKESRGSSWDSEGNNIRSASFGPPFALIQGTLEAHGIIFDNIPREDCPQITTGSVAWVGSGPEFFIGLANHNEWKNS